MKFDTLFEEVIKDYSFVNTNNRAAFVFGRMNPPTIGHSMLLDKAKQIAQAEGRELFVFLSKTSPAVIEQSREGKNMQKTHRDNALKNPLEFEYKLNALNEAMPDIRFVADPIATNPFNAGYWLRDRGFKDVVLFAGSDRIPQYQAQFKPYLFHDDPEKSFNFEQFNVVSVGDRDPDSDDAVSSASGTKAREYAIADDVDNLQKILVQGLSRDKVSEIAGIIRDVHSKYTEHSEAGAIPL